MAIYMKYGSIDGAVTTKGFEKWIEVTSLSWGVGRSVGTAARGSTTRESSEPSISEVTISKVTDVASIKLFEDSVAGDFHSAVKFKFTTTSNKAVTTFLSYELTDCGVSGFSVSSGGDAPIESLSLNFTKLSMTYIGLDSSTSGSPETAGYDLQQMATI